MSRTDRISEDDIEEMQALLEQNRSYGNDSGGHWKSLDEAPDDAVEATVDAIEETIEESPNSSGFFKPVRLLSRIGEDDVDRSKDTSWVSRVCSLLDEEEHDYRVTIEQVSRNRHKNGRTWKATRRERSE